MAAAEGHVMSHARHEPAHVAPPTIDVPDWAGRIGRKWKVEYVGMASVLAIICAAAFGGLPHSSQSAIATAGTLLLFFGLKKKTRDHISASFLLFGAAALAHPAVTHESWFVPYALFGACISAMEGYLEKRHRRILALPLVLGMFAAVSPWWWLGLLFVTAYLLQPRPGAPRLRKQLAWILAASTLVGAGVTVFVAQRSRAAEWQAAPPGRVLLAVYALIAVASLVCLVSYWSQLARPHRLNTIVFGILAPFDARVVAMFGMVSMVLLSASVFRDSVDSERLRPYFKHAEWYFFPVVFAVALGLLLLS